MYEWVESESLISLALKYMYLHSIIIIVTGLHFWKERKRNSNKMEIKVILNILSRVGFWAFEEERKGNK